MIRLSTVHVESQLLLQFEHIPCLLSGCGFSDMRVRASARASTAPASAATAFTFTFRLTARLVLLDCFLLCLRRLRVVDRRLLQLCSRPVEPPLVERDVHYLSRPSLRDVVLNVAQRPAVDMWTVAAVALLARLLLVGLLPSTAPRDKAMGVEFFRRSLEYCFHIDRRCQRIRELNPISLHARVLRSFIILQNSFHVEQYSVSSLLLHPINPVRWIGLYYVGQALDQLTQPEQNFVYILPIAPEYLCEVELLYFGFWIDVSLGY